MPISYYVVHVFRISEIPIFDGVASIHDIRDVSVLFSCRYP